MKIIGLTGDVAAGKTVVAGFFKLQDFPVFSADEIVHTMYLENKDVIAAVRKICPNACVSGFVDRIVLREYILQDKLLLTKLENIVFKYFKDQMLHFISSSNEDIVILEIPLLFESNMDKYCDYIINVTAYKELRYKRAVQNKKMDPKIFEILDEKQNEIVKENEKVDFTLENNSDKSELFEKVMQVLSSITDMKNDEKKFLQP